MKVDGIEVVIEADALKANQQMDLLIKKLNSLSASLRTVKVGNLSNIGKSMSGSSKQISSASSALQNMNSNLQAFSTKSSMAVKQSRSLASAFGTFYANCFLAIRGIKKLGTAINSTMDYIETYNYFNVTMGKIGKEFGETWEDNGESNAKDYTNAFKEELNNLTSQMTGFRIGDEGGLYSTGSIGLGLDPEAIMNFQASIASITNAVGMTGKLSVMASDALTRLAADMSSLKNVDLETVMTNFQSGLIGQSRALYKYGIDITNNTLQTYAFANGIEKAVSEMTQAEKMQLRLLVILDNSKIAWGDMANTINGTANQYRLLKQQISNLAREIGAVLVPIVRTILPYINGIVVALRSLFSWLGVVIYGTEKWEKLMDGISDGYNDTGLDALGESADDTSDALESANKAAKKLKATIHGYDELHVATDPTSGSSDASGSGIDLSNEISKLLDAYKSTWDEAMSKMENDIQRIADNISAAFKRMWVAIEPARKAIMSLWNEGLSKLGTFTWTALKDFYDGFLVPMGKWAFGTNGAGITRLIDVINSLLKKVQWDKINKSLREFWVAIEPYAEQFGEGLIDFFEKIGGIAVDGINNLPDLFDKITASLNSGDPEKARDWGYALGVIATALLALKGVGIVVGGILAVGTAVDGMATAIGGLKMIGSTLGKVFAPLSVPFANLGEVFASCSGGIGTLAEASTGLLGISAPMLAVAAAVAAIAVGLAHAYATNEEVRESFSSSVAVLRDGLQPILDNLSNTVLPDLQSGWEKLKEILSPLTDFLSDAFSSTWIDIICPLLEEIGTTILPELSKAFEVFWKDRMVPLGNFLSGVFAPIFEVLGKVLSSLWQNVIVPLARAVISILGKAFKLIATILTNIVMPVLSKISFVFQLLWDNVLKPIADNVVSHFAPRFETAMSVIKEIIESLELVFGGFLDFITGVFTGDWEKAWEGIKDFFAGIANSLMSIIEGTINNAIDGINGFLGKFNSISEAIGDKIDVEISIPEFKKVSLPRFENGGFPNTGEMFLARENGIPEMVGSIGGRTAVANNDQITTSIKEAVVDGMMEVFMATQSNSSEENQDVHLHVHIGNDELGVATYRGLKDASRRGLIPKMV